MILNKIKVKSFIIEKVQQQKQNCSNDKEGHSKEMFAYFIKSLPDLENMTNTSLKKIQDVENTGHTIFEKYQQNTLEKYKFTKELKQNVRNAFYILNNFIL